MAPSPVTAPSQNNSPPSGTKNSSSEASPPSSSPKKNSSPPPASPPPPEKKSPSPPPPKASSPPPPATTPSPKHSSPPPPEQKNPPSPPPPSESNNKPPKQKSNPPPPPAATDTPSTPATPPSEPFIPPPPRAPGENAPPPGPSGALVPPLPPGTQSSNTSSGSSSSASRDRLPAESNGSSSPKTKTSSSSSPSSEHTTTIAIIAGVGVAVAILILALAIFCLVCGRKKKRKHYYMDPGVAPPPGKEYYTPGSAQWNTPQDHIIRLTPPPGMMGTPGGWVPQAPHGQQNTSKDFSAGTTPQNHVPSPAGNMALGFSKCQFTYAELAAATGDFSKANLLGQGGFGYVHKGVLPNGQEVAVKSLKTGSGQGEREFQAEVEIISRVHHRHLVSLVGYCIADGQRMLVYEFVANKTMEFHLHGKNQPVMDWPTRLRIALGSAKGLGYLHEDCHPKIIHRDIKAANILLDSNYEAMVADFGLAKLSSDNYTHISTRVMGTFGYMAPEYASSGKLTDKSDVFSFGVMLLELITGRRPLDLSGKYMEEDSLVDWARPLLTKAIELGEYKELVDPRLGDNYNPQEMARMVACASASIRHSARRRPKMSQIVRALDGDSSLDDLNDGGKGGGNNGNTEHYDTSAYNADMMKFRQMVMTSQEFTSSEYNPSSSSSEYSREMNGHSTNGTRKL